MTESPLRCPSCGNDRTFVLEHRYPRLVQRATWVNDTWSFEEKREGEETMVCRCERCHRDLTAEWNRVREVDR